MDDDQFDALSARLAGHMTRRRGIALGSALGLAGIGSVSRVDARKRKKKKKKCKGGCGSCATCVKGTCQPVADGAVCGQGGCTICIAGACQAVANGNTCDPSGCRTCQNGTCQSATDGTLCSAGACQAGACRCRFAMDCPGDCNCAETFPAGVNTCWAQAGDPCNIPGNCDADTDCGPGEACLEQFCSSEVPYGVCWPVCTA